MAEAAAAAAAAAEPPHAVAQEGAFAAATADAPVLHYFPARGRAEPIRLALAYRRVAWFEPPIAPVLRLCRRDLASYPFRQLPRLVDGRRGGADLVQSMAILRHLGRALDLYGGGGGGGGGGCGKAAGGAAGVAGVAGTDADADGALLAAARVDMVLDGVQDLRARLRAACFAGRPAPASAVAEAPAAAAAPPPPPPSAAAAASPASAPAVPEGTPPRPPPRGRPPQDVVDGYLSTTLAPARKLAGSLEGWPGPGLACLELLLRPPRRHPWPRACDEDGEPLEERRRPAGGGGGDGGGCASDDDDDGADDADEGVGGAPPARWVAGGAELSIADIAVADLVDAHLDAGVSEWADAVRRRFPRLVRLRRRVFAQEGIAAYLASRNRHAPLFGDDWRP